MLQLVSVTLIGLIVGVTDEVCAPIIRKLLVAPESRITHHCRKNVGHAMVTSSCDHRLANINVGHTTLRVLVAIRTMVT